MTAYVPETVLDEPLIIDPYCPETVFDVPLIIEAFGAEMLLL
jgi:hypothetical protein